MRTPKRSTRKKLSAALALLCCFSILVGSFAFFTDRESATTNAVAGNIDLVFNDISASKTGTNKIESNNEFAVDQSWKNGIVADEDSLKKMILDELKDHIGSGLPKKVNTLLEVLRLEASIDSLPMYQDRIHVANGTWFLDGSFSSEKNYCRRNIYCLGSKGTPLPYDEATNKNRDYRQTSLPFPQSTVLLPQRQ